MPTNPSLVKLRAERKRLGMCRECGADISRGTRVQGGHRNGTRCDICASVNRERTKSYYWRRKLNPFGVTERC